MSIVSGLPSAALSRRLTLRRMAVVAGGAALLSATMSGRRAAAEGTKVTQAAAGYQDSPQGDQSCASCSQFVAPAACNLVEGSISPGAWCKLYAKKAG